MRKRQKPISIKFVLFLIVSIAGISIYLLTPNDNKFVNSKKTFEEQLRYSYTRPNKHIEKKEVLPVYTKKEVPLISDDNYIYANPTNNVGEIKNNISYEELLDKLIELPKSYNTAELIVKEILEYKGFDRNAVNIVVKDVNQNNVKTSGTTMVAQFNFKTGTIAISNKALYSLEKGILIAVIAHELDHFEKIAQVFKSMTDEEFNLFIKENNLTDINIAFWKNACKYATLTNFDKKTYKDALQRLINHKSIDTTSLYSDFYQLSENMRNPLEISAYAVSDYIYEYYKIPITEGPMLKLTKKFNEVDWAIFNLTKHHSIYRNERITFFNYFLANAITKKFPKYQNLYNECIEYNNGNLNAFWDKFKSDYADFFISNNASETTINTFIEIFDEMINLTKNEGNEKNFANALYQNIEYLKQNAKDEESIKTLKKEIEKYFSLAKNNNILSEKVELDLILTLICIKNNLKQSDTKNISLFYVKIPEELNKYYTINKHQKFKFIYDNNEFKRLRKENNIESEPELLIQLLNNNRLEN